MADRTPEETARETAHKIVVCLGDGKTREHTNGCDHATTAIAAAIQAERPQWRPIEEAPKDGTAILLFFPEGFCHVGTWLPKSNVWAVTYRKPDLHYFDVDRPTHWMPLPTPPGETT